MPNPLERQKQQTDREDKDRNLAGLRWHCTDDHAEKHEK